jgi:hypothetical protein
MSSRSRTKSWLARSTARFPACRFHLFCAAALWSACGSAAAFVAEREGCAVVVGVLASGTFSDPWPLRAPGAIPPSISLLLSAGRTRYSQTSPARIPHRRSPKTHRSLSVEFTMRTSRPRTSSIVAVSRFATNSSVGDVSAPRNVNDHTMHSASEARGSSLNGLSTTDSCRLSRCSGEELDRAATSPPRPWSG